MAGRETRAVETAGLAQGSPRDQRGNSEIRAIGITCSWIGDAPILPDLLDQIADCQRVGMFTADVATERTTTDLLALFNGCQSRVRTFAAPNKHAVRWTKRCVGSQFSSRTRGCALLKLQDF